MAQVEMLCLVRTRQPQGSGSDTERRQILWCVGSVLDCVSQHHHPEQEKDMKF